MRFYLFFSFLLICVLSVSGCAKPKDPAKRMAQQKKILAHAKHKKSTMVSKAYPKLGRLRVEGVDVYTRKGVKVRLLSIFRKNGKSFPYITGQARNNRVITIAREFARGRLCRKTGIRSISNGVTQFKLVPDKTLTAVVKCK